MNEVSPFPIPMPTMTMPEMAAMPDSHVASLSAIEDGYWWYRGRCYWAESLVRSQGNDFTRTRYVDVGCGTGGFAKELSSRLGIKDVWLADGDPAVLRHAEKKGFKTTLVNFEKDFKLPSPTLVSCMDVLEHIEDDAGLLKKLYRELAPGGQLVISVPAHPSLFSEWDRQLGHHRRYTRQALRNCLEEAGFTIQALTFQWAFLFPVGYVRKFKTKRYEKNMEFEPVPGWINSTLMALSKAERVVTRIIPMPFGTSLMALVKKK